MASGSTAPFSGDHTDLTNVSSGQHHAAATPDGSTIVRDSNGDLQAKGKETIIVGDFENDNLGSWNPSNPDLVKARSFHTGAENTNFYAELRSNLGQNSSMNRDLDFSKYVELVFFFERSGSSDLDVSIGGSTAFSKGEGDDSNYLRVVIDVSSKSGVQKLKFANNSNGGQTFVDRIKVKTTGVSLGTSSNGAGGTA